MSTTAARRASDVLNNTQWVISVELLCGARALSLRLRGEPDLQLGAGTGPARALVERTLAHLTEDATPAAQVAAVHEALWRGGPDPLRAAAAAAVSGWPQGRVQ